MISMAVVSILFLVSFSENCAGLNAVQVHINDTKRSPVIGQQQQQQQQQQNSFGRDYREFTLDRYLYGITGPSRMLNGEWSEFFEWGRIKREMSIISSEIAAHMAKKNVQVQPPMTDVFNAFLKVDLLSIRVVILGQDPTYQQGQATGLAFSLNPDLKLEYPTSTGNILKLLQKYDYKVNLENGDLTKWTKHGVFLLNSALTITVRYQESDWHQNQWRHFTKMLISYISIDATQPLVWMLWGNTAKSFRGLIDEQRHLVLTGVHPSPHNGDLFVKQYDFFGEANKFLVKKGQKQIDWNLV